MLPLDHLYNLLCLLDHPIILIIHFLHPHDIVIPSLLRQRDPFLHLLLSPVLKQKEVFLQSLDFVFKLLDRLFMSREIKLDVGSLSKSLVDDIFLNRGHLIVKEVLRFFHVFFL